jgi:hypothetical protein
MAGVPQNTQAPVSAAGAFNNAAARDVYDRHQVLARDTGVMASIRTMFSSDGDINIDRTIRGASLDVNFEALRAGYVGTPQEADVNKLTALIQRHQELRQGATTLLQGEGENVIGGLSQLVTGNGRISMDQLVERMDSNPEQRRIFGRMMTEVGRREDLPMDYAIRFTNDAMAAAQNPTDTAALNRFRTTARAGGIDTGDVEREGMMNMFGDFMRNPQQAITRFMDSMNLPPELKEGLTGILNTVVGFYTQVIGDMAYGRDGTRGLIDIGREAWGNAQEAGRDARREYLPQQQPQQQAAAVPAPGTP